MAIESVSHRSTWGSAVRATQASEARPVAAAAAAGGSPAAEADVLELSAAAEAAAGGGSSLERLPGLFGIVEGSGPRGAITIDDIADAQADAQAALKSKLNRALAAAGIDTRAKIDLRMAGDGSVFVANDHPQADRIEQLFVDDPSLRDAMARVTCLTEFVAAAREGMAFQAAYARNPQAAVAQFWYLFNDSAAPTLTLSVEGGAYCARYEGLGRPAQLFEF